MANFKRVTIEDVAREAQVSITTVSRYLNGHYEYMSEKTRMKIANIIQRLEYRPNIMAQGLKANRTKQIAVVVVNISYPFCASVIRSLSEVMAPAGYGLLVFDSNGDKQRERDFLLSLRSQNVDGIVIQTNGANADLLQNISKELALVMIDRRIDIANAANVVTNNEQVSYDVTHYLFTTGYENVIYVTEMENGVSTREERLRGYRNACLKAKRQEWIERLDKSNEESYFHTAERIRKNMNGQSFAIYTANGLLMLRLYPWLQKLGIQTPNPMGLATFDDPDWASVTTPPLTSIRQPTEEMGRLAAKLILEKVETGSTENMPVLQILPSELIIRDSTMLKD
ncbi:LacI family DNA-binding transcriptional regulator [Alicyclobacillus tolerans]|uniref:LacI family DNA-binding transcriptional regulator n=1 Tax=Alicyclobacillus tolerans TaxID=90970 RepID=UPI003B7F73E4